MIYALVWSSVGLWLAHLERLTPPLPESHHYLATSEFVTHLTGEKDGALITDLGERMDILEMTASVRPTDLHLTRLGGDAGPATGLSRYDGL